MCPECPLGELEAHLSCQAAAVLAEEGQLQVPTNSGLCGRSSCQWGCWGEGPEALDG